MRYLKLEGAPFNDEKAEYHHDIHLYIVLPSHVKQEYGQDFYGTMTTEDIDDLHKRITYQIRNYIRSSQPRANYDVTEYKIAKKNYKGRYLGREDFTDAVIAQILYAKTSKGDELGDHHGVDLKKGTMIEGWADKRRQLKVSDEVKEILYGSQDNLINQAELIYEIDPDDYRSDY